jgi:cytosine deaminase
MPFEITADTKVTDEVLDKIARMPTQEIAGKVDPTFMKNLTDAQFMRMAVLLAQKGYDEGGCPIGGVIIDNDTRQIMGKGHNTLMQEGDPTTHGETAATQDAGRVALLQGKKFVNFDNATMFTTLTPCDVCCAQLVYRTRPARVVIGDVTNAPSSAPIIEAGKIKVDVLEDPKGVELYKRYSEQHPDKHYSDWLGNGFWEKIKDRSPDDRLTAAVKETSDRRQAQAALFSPFLSRRISPGSGESRRTAGGSL